MGSPWYWPAAGRPGGPATHARASRRAAFSRRRAHRRIGLLPLRLRAYAKARGVWAEGGRNALLRSELASRSPAAVAATRTAVVSHATRRRFGTRREAWSEPGREPDPTRCSTASKRMAGRAVLASREGEAMGDRSCSRRAKR